MQNSNIEDEVLEELEKSFDERDDYNETALVNLDNVNIIKKCTHFFKLQKTIFSFETYILYFFLEGKFGRHSRYK